MSCSCSNKENITPINALSKLLANSYILFLKTQNIHWNVTGPQFKEIHLMTEEHYNNLFLAIDTIAERIRMSGSKAPATFSEFLELACIDEKISSQTAEGMLTQLLEDHKLIIFGIKFALKAINETDDFGALDILNSRLEFHEKTVWMISSTLNK